ncbi:MAG TPA: TonB-dependent receptor [Pyrinomonadaceae bacterium]|nr:TonB-dependent receptor [Pyrinomonadaceae bacterium]
MPNLKGIILTILLLSVTFSTAQTTPGTRGQVVDEAGSAIAGATVSLIRKGTSDVAWRTVTTSEGYFDFPDAFDGTIIVEAPRFLRYESQWNSSSDRIITLVRTAVTATVNVTGSETRLEETAASVIALNKESLDSSGAAVIDDKLRQIPGFSLLRRAGSRTANPTTAGVSLRGIGASGASRALVLNDGIPINDPFGGWIYWGRIPSESIAQVEVLRGSSSDLYGNSAIGGIVSIVPKETSVKPILSTEVSYGSQNTSTVSAFASAGMGDWTGSIAAEKFRTDGFIPVADAERGPVDSKANVDRWTVNPLLQWSPAKNIRTFAAVNVYSEVRKNGTPLQNNDTRLRSYSIGGDFAGDRFGSIKLRVYGGPQLYHQSFSAISVGRSSETLTRLQTAPVRAAGFSARWSSDFATKYLFAAGFEGRRVRGRSDEVIFAAGSTSTVSSGGTETSFGGYAGLTAPLTSRIVVSGGIRYDHWRESSGFSRTRSVAAGEILRSFPDRNESALSPRASLLLKVREGISLAASFSTGFRQPTLNELYRTFRVGDVLTLANENLKAERARNFEVGVIGSSFERRLYGRGVAFCTVLSKPVANLTLAVTPALITRQRQNLGQTRSCGFEADAQYRLSDEISLSGGYLFADARVTDFPPDRTLEKRRIPQIARHQFTFQIQYANPRYINLGLQLRTGSNQFDDDQNRLQLKAFSTIDAIVSRRISRYIEIFAAIENLFDSKIESGRTPVLTLASPQGVRIGIRLRRL